MSGLARVVGVALLCAVTLPGATGTELVAGVAVMALAALLSATSRRARVDGAPVPVAPTGCAAETTCATPLARLHQLDPDAAGHPRPRAPGRPMAVAAA